MMLIIFYGACNFPTFSGFLHGKLRTRDCLTLHSLCIIESKKNRSSDLCPRICPLSPTSLIFFRQNCSVKKSINSVQGGRVNVLTEGQSPHFLVNVLTFLSLQMRTLTKMKVRTLISMFMIRNGIKLLYGVDQD